MLKQVKHVEKDIAVLKENLGAKTESEIRKSIDNLIRRTTSVQSGRIESIGLAVGEA